MLKTLSLKVVLWIFVLLFFSMSNGHCNPINLAVIEQIESSGNPKAIGNGNDIGSFQITPILLKEYNRLTGHHLQRKDLFDHTINLSIAQWYIEERIPQLLKHYNKPVTIENIIICYNAGISYVAHNKPIPTKTKQYIKKYKDLTHGATS